MQPDNKRRMPWLLLAGLLLSLSQCAVPPESAGPAALSEPVIATQEETLSPPTLTTQPWPDSESVIAHIHLVTIPANYPIEVAISEELRTVEDFAADTAALAVINGGFFDPANGQTTSFVTINGTLVADPVQNKRLLANADLKPYLDQIFNRSEFRRYNCGDDIRYGITFHNESVPDGCTLHSALGAGPQLLPKDTAPAEGFTDYIDQVLVRDAIASQQRHARSAIGIRSDGSLVWIVVAQPPSGGGMTLAELADFMSTLNIHQALNLDGGSSSSLYFEQQIVHGLSPNPPSPEESWPGPNLRPIKSVLWLPNLQGDE